MLQVNSDDQGCNYLSGLWCQAYNKHKAAINTSRNDTVLRDTSIFQNMFFQPIDNLFLVGDYRPNQIANGNHAD